MLTSLLASKVLYTITLTLLHFLWQGGLIALTLKIILLLTPKEKPQWRYAFASSAMFLNILLPIITFFILYQPEVSLPIALIDNLLPITSSSSTLVQVNWHNTLLHLFPYIALLWLSISLLLASKLILELIKTNQLPNKHTITPEASLLVRFEALIKKVKLTQTPRLLISLKTDVPMALGVLKPVVLIPASMLSGLTPAQLDMLILHELAHIRRHDYLINLIQTFVETVLFFHPCCFWVSKQMRTEREYCSDDIAVQHCSNPIAYAKTLTETASLCHQHRHHTIPKMAMAASGGDLKQRVLRIVKKNHCSENRYSSKGLAAICVLTMGLCLCIQLYATTTNTYSPLTSVAQKNTIQDNSSLRSTKENNLLLMPSTTENASLDIVFDFNAKQLAYKPVDLIMPIKLEIDDEGNATKNTSTQLSASKEQASTDEFNIILEKTANKLEVAQHNHEPKQSSAKHQAAPTEGRDIIINQKTAAITKTSTKVSQKNKPETDKANILKPLESEASNTLLVLNKEDLVIEQVDSTTNAADQKSNVDMLAKTEAELSIQKAIKDAQLIKGKEPRYPATAQLQGIELDVMVNFTVNTDGRVEDIEFESKARSKHFKSAIRSAMKKWRFLPAKVDGKPIESTLTKIFSFSLLS